MQRAMCIDLVEDLVSTTGANCYCRVIVCARAKAVGDDEVRNLTLRRKVTAEEPVPESRWKAQVRSEQSG